MRKPNEKWNGCDIHIRQEWIFEINLKERGVRIPALNVRLPKQDEKSADPDEHDYYLKKCR